MNDYLEKLKEHFKRKSKKLQRIEAGKMLLERYNPDDLNISKEEKNKIICESILVLLNENAEIERKYAASILIKHLLPNKEADKILLDENIIPFDRSDKRLNKWKKEVLKKGKCEKCGSKERLEAHHIIKWADYPNGRIDPKNGMCLCHNCHTKEHILDASYYMMKAK